MSGPKEKTVMDPAQREAFFDAEIGPPLMELAKKCQDHGISFVATAEWTPGEVSKTASLQAEAGVGIRLVELAMQANGNVDAIIFALMKYGRVHGHSSLCLAMLERQSAEAEKLGATKGTVR